MSVFLLTPSFRPPLNGCPTASLDKYIVKRIGVFPLPLPLFPPPHTAQPDRGAHYLGIDIFAALFTQLNAIVRWHARVCVFFPHALFLSVRCCFTHRCTHVNTLRARSPADRPRHAAKKSTRLNITNKRARLGGTPGPSSPRGPVCELSRNSAQRFRSFALVRAGCLCH